MEEEEYQSTYNEIASVRCVFEKTLTNHHAKCALSEHFCLADREGYSCNSSVFSSKCREILGLLRKNSIFVLKLQEINGPLPHNMEIRVQAGGLLGMAKLFSSSSLETENNKRLKIADISQVITQVEEKYGKIENLPFNEVVQSVVQFKGRRRRQRE